MLIKSSLDINEFELQERIGHGGFFNKFKVKNKNTGKINIAKIADEEDNPDNPNQNDFIYKEINTLTKIKHPCFIKLIGYSKIDFNQEPKPVIITEFCKNGTLRSNLDLVEQSLAELSWNDTVILKIIYGISKAMAFLHLHNIIYKNLNPEVISLDEEYNPKITDLSTAEKIDTNSCTKGIGLPMYMSPEIWEFDEYTTKSDVYAFSMIVYELITYRKPFEKTETPFSIAKRVIKNERPKLDNVPDCYKKLITRCWAHDPNDRPSFEEIIQILKTDPGFVGNGVDKEEFFDYAESIDTSEINFEPDKEIIPISEEIINQPITKELKQQFKNNPQKIKYFIISESKQEISLLSCHFSHNQNLNIDIDLEKLKNIISKKYLNLTELTPDCSNVQQNLNYIMKAIDDEYNELYDQIKTKLTCSSNLTVLNKIIKIIEDSIETKKTNNEIIQKEINQVLEDHPDKLLFNTDKLKKIPLSSTPISEMLLSLYAIKNNPKFKNPLLKEQPKMSVLYSPSIKVPSYSESLVNILSGNCFFLTLYGNHSTTRQVLSALSNNEIETHQEKDIVTIYGPVDFVSFGKTVSLSFDILKRFNGNFPNLYFIEVSSDYEDQTMKEWCEFISFISHYLIFCSNIIPSQSDIENFQNSMLLKNFNGVLINCCPYSKESINFVDSNHEIKAHKYFNIDFLLDNILLSYLFADIYKIRFNFIPSETVDTLSFLFFDKGTKMIVQKDIMEKFKQAIMQNYSTQIHNKAIQYFNVQVQKIINEIYASIKLKEYIDNFHLQETLEFLVDKTLEYLYTNIYVEFWDDMEIEKISKVLKAEVKNDFASSILPIKRIEAMGKLLTLLKSKKYQSNLPEVQSILTFLKGFDSTFNINSIPNAQDEIHKFILKTEQIYNNSVSIIKENYELMKTVDSFCNQLYSFLDENPVVSDKEYSLYYNKLYELNSTSKNPNIEKYINITLNIRKVLDDYKPKKITVGIHEKSFKQGGIKLQSNSLEFIIKPTMTCHEFFDFIKKSFNLENIPFHVMTMSTNQFNKPIDIEVLDDQTNLLLLNSNNFKVHYGIHIHSTQTLIESLIPQKTIKIANDFIIQTNSKDAKYTVDFPQDHKGWFDVEWNIKNISANINETDYTLIYLTMTAEEISFLQEGNLLYHQSYQNGQWVDEYDPIYLSFPDCQTAVFPLRHCSIHKLVKRFIRIAGSGFLLPSTRRKSVLKSEATTKKPEATTKKPEAVTKKPEAATKKPEATTKKPEATTKKSEVTTKKSDNKEEQDIFSELINSVFSRNWEDEDGDIEYKRGGISYYLPVGYSSEGIKVENFIEKTCVGFHGTCATVLYKVIKEGFKLPSELPGKGVRDKHIELGVTKFGIPNFPNAIFVSPSIKYATYYAYNDNKIVAESKINSYIHVGHIQQNQVLLIILQTRVIPNSYTVNANTTPYNFFDPHYDDEHLEWRIADKKNLFPYRILFKTVSLRDYLFSFELKPEFINRLI